MSKNAVTRKQLEEWGYTEVNGEWVKKPSTPMGKLDTHKHSQCKGALDGKIKAPRRGKVSSQISTEGPRYIVTLIAHIMTRMDDDNLANALKPIRDEVADYLGIDDGSINIRWQYGQVETRGNKGVIVKIELI